jgi:hypothetical protein
MHYQYPPHQTTHKKENVFHSKMGHWVKVLTCANTTVPQRIKHEVNNCYFVQETSYQQLNCTILNRDSKAATDI